MGTALRAVSASSVTRLGLKRAAGEKDGEKNSGMYGCWRCGEELLAKDMATAQRGGGVEYFGGDDGEIGRLDIGREEHQLTRGESGDTC